MPSRQGRSTGSKKRPAPVLRKSDPINPARPQVPVRPALGQVRPGANPHRAEQRVVRRAAVRREAEQIQSLRPRPVVRPSGPAQRVMPKTPPPATLARPVRRPTAPQSAARGSAARQSAAPRSSVPARAAAAGAGLAAAGFLAVNAANAHADIAGTAQSLQSALIELRTRSTFEDMQRDIATLDQELRRGGELLESAREKGYAYQSDLEDRLFQGLGQWETVRAQTLSRIEQQAHAIQPRLNALDPMVQRLNANLYSSAAAEPHLRSTQTEVNQLLAEVGRIESDLENAYADIEVMASQVILRLKEIHWALDQLAAAKFALERGEDLVMAVPARWDQEGKDDPEGVLYLTDRRLVFERKEKVATKKILFITTASELVQEVIIDQPLDKIESYQAENKGLFGHQDFLAIKFADPKLGGVAIHLSGQDSKHWAEMLDQARSGKLEAQRAGGAGLSVSDLTRPLTNADIMSMQSEVNALQDEMMLKTARAELSRLENEVRNLERSLARLRAGGYAIEKGLEADVQVLAAQWDRVKINAEATLEYQAGLLGEQMRAIHDDLARLVGLTGNLAAARPVYMQLKSAIASAEAQADAAEDTVLAQFDEYGDEVESLAAHLEWIDWMLGALSTASFRLLATESGVAAVEAVFLHPSWEPQNGILFLTDQRLLWEDRVGDYELKLDLPVQEVLDARLETADEQQVLVFQLGSQSTLPLARFQLGLPVADDWIKMVGRARSGGYTQDRAVQLSEAELERIRNAPQQCSNCGAVYSAPILRGQTELSCEYCGLVTRF